VLCGRREPCSQQVCEHGLACVQAFSGDMPNFSRFEAWGGAGISVTRKSTLCPPSNANASASDCRISS
jgi:hypothetical protein